MVWRAGTVYLPSIPYSLILTSNTHSISKMSFSYCTVLCLHCKYNYQAYLHILQNHSSSSIDVNFIVLPWKKQLIKNSRVLITLKDVSHINPDCSEKLHQFFNLLKCINWRCLGHWFYICNSKTHYVIIL